MSVGLARDELTTPARQSDAQPTEPGTGRRAGGTPRNPRGYAQL